MAWQRGLPGGTGVKKKICKVPCQSCNIYGGWANRWGGGSLKVIISGEEATKVGVGQFHGAELTPLDTMYLFKNNCKPKLQITYSNEKYIPNDKILFGKNNI